MKCDDTGPLQHSGEELPKNEDDFVFQPEANDKDDEDFEDPLNSK